MTFTARRLKYCVRRPVCNGIGAAAEFDEPSWPRYVRITDIAGPRRLRDDTFRSLPPEQAAEAPFDVGDVLAAAVGATFGKTYLHCVDIGPAAFAGYLVRISPSSDFDPRFVAFWSESRHYWDQVNTSFVQSTIQNFSASKYGELRLPVPAIAQQRAIADYLDRETARLDALVAAKERVLGLLAEKRRALITRAVTRGLDPRASLRDSGIPWLGKIPAYWSLCHLKRVLSSLDYGISESVDVTGCIAVLRMGDIRDGELDYSNIGFVDSVEESLLLRPGDLLFNRTNSLDQIGKVALFRGRSDYPVSFASYLVRLRCKPSASPDFLNWLLNSAFPLAWGRSEALPAIGQANLNPNRYAYLPIALPPLPEQYAIVAHIAAETAKVDGMRCATERTIALLKERRAALIAAAITGQIDIPEATA